MASILRSSKFVRYIAGFARNVVVNTPREFDGSFINATQCICGAITPTFATQASAQFDQNLERSLRRIDQDVRKSGRISRRDIEDVLEEIRNTRSATSSQSLLVIRCCGNLVPEELPEVRTKLVQEIWNTLEKLHVPMDISHYNALLRVYLENEHSFSPTEFLSYLESKGVEPNRVTYQRLIARYCQDGDIEGATKILEFMREKQLPVNENVFNALIVGHSEAGDLESARGIINVMTQAGLEPSADTYTTLLCGYAKTGDIEAMKEILNECESKEIYLLDKDYLDIVYALSTNGHSNHIPVILDKVRKAVGYNQDAINIIYRLINKGLVDDAFEVLKSMTRNTSMDGSALPSGSFFIRQLIKANTPLETILKYCTIFEESQLYERALILATEVSLQEANDKLAYPLLKELQKRDVEIRQHFFWPLIVAKSRESGNNGVLEVLREMEKLGINPNVETIREYVIPNLKGKSSEIISMLREANISVGTAASSLLQSLLQNNELEEAAIIATRVSAYYVPEVIKRPLTNAFYKTKDVESYVTVLRAIHENLDRKILVKPEAEEAKVDKPHVIGGFIWDLSVNKQNFVASIENVLEELVKQGLGISTTIAEKLQDKLDDQMNDNISVLLAKLTSGELTPQPIINKAPSYTPSSQMNIPQLERLIENLSSKGQDVKGHQRHLLTLYYRAKDLEKTEELLQKLEHSGDFKYTPGLYAQLLDLYAYHDNLEKAMSCLEKLRELEPQFKLDNMKIVRLANLVYKKVGLDESIKILESLPKDETQEEKGYGYTATLWRFMNTIADEGKVEELNKLFNVLIDRGFMEPNNILLGPLVKVHLNRDEVDAALEKLEWCVHQYKATPWKNELACKLIQSEDAEKLQKLTDLSTLVHGEVNSLYDLVFSFVECGRIRQARKILETPGLQTRPQRINSACERYRQEGMVKPLEGLKAATKDLNHFDRNDIYYQLLLSYIKQDDVEKATNLWTQMQEEDVTPSDEFLINLGKFMKDRGLEVPFVVPKKSPPPPPPTKSAVQPPPKTKVQQFRHILKSGNVNAALRQATISLDGLMASDLSALIEKLVQENRINEATQVVRKMLTQNITPISRVFRFLLNKLAVAGEVDTLNEIGSKIDQETKKIVSFDNRICHANVVAGKGEEYLDHLEKQIENANEEDLVKLGEEFPRGGAYGILERLPELVDKFEALSIKYANKNILAPLNVLWTHYFINGKDEKAEEIWNNYLKDAPRVMFQKVVQTARENKDANLVTKLIEHLKISNVTEGAIGNAYSCLLDVTVAKGSDEETIKAFEAAIKDVPIDFINRTAILRVRDIYTKLDKPFDYKIPAKNVKSTTSSSSSSDDDKKR